MSKEELKEKCAKLREFICEEFGVSKACAREMESNAYHAYKRKEYRCKKREERRAREKENEG